MVLPMLLFGVVVPFTVIDQKDPITDKRQVVAGVVSEKNILAIGCEDTRARSIDIELYPRAYSGDHSSSVIFGPHVIIRFGDDKPVEVPWTFDNEKITLGSALGLPQNKAGFLDALMKTNHLVIRYFARPGKAETVIFDYDLRPGQLNSVIRACGPEKVIKILKDSHSPALLP